MTLTEKVKTPAQRRKTSDDKQRALGRKGRKVWATPTEHKQVEALLVKLRRITKS